MNINGIDVWRKLHLAGAELVDAWRVVPRVIVLGYVYLLWYVVNWYMKLQPYMLPGCKLEDMTNCVVEAPTTQHAVLLTAIVSVAAAIFGFYTSSGKKWNGFTYWNHRQKDENINDSVKE